MFDLWHHRKLYFSLTLNAIHPCARGAVQNDQVCGIFVIVNKYSPAKNPDIHCSFPILKHSFFCLRDGAFASLIFKFYIFELEEQIFLPQISV